MSTCYPANTTVPISLASITVFLDRLNDEISVFEYILHAKQTYSRLRLIGHFGSRAVDPIKRNLGVGPIKRIELILFSCFCFQIIFDFECEFIYTSMYNTTHPNDDIIFTMISHIIGLAEIQVQFTRFSDLIEH